MPRAEIATKQAMFALEKLHAELGGKIQENKNEAKRLTVSMMQVEAVMKMLAPGYDVRPIAVRRRKPNPWYRRGTVFRHAMDVLRVAEKPLSVREITERMLVAKGVADPDRKALRDLAGGVDRSLRNHKGKSVEMVGEGMPARWSIPKNL